jgi:hypothetical protein
MSPPARRGSLVGPLAGLIVAWSCVSADPPAGALLADAVQEAGDVQVPPTGHDERDTGSKTEAMSSVQPEATATESDEEEEPEAAIHVPEPAKALSAEEYAALLETAHETLKEAGVHKSPAFRSHGRLPDEQLKRAYAEGRAQAFRGRPAQVEQWMGIAKFGGHYDPSGKPRPPSRSHNGGALARYNLTVVVESEDKAYLHVEVPTGGPATEAGKHRAFVRQQWWFCLADRLEPGVDYALYKTNGEASLHRQWAQEWVIERLAALAQSYKKDTGGPIGIGDMSLVVGGKISDHWTHRLGVDADLYLLRYSDPEASSLEGVRHSWHSWKRGVSVWSSDPDGRRDREEPIAGQTPSSKLLRSLAEAALAQDDLHFFVHNAVDVLDEFDGKAQERRPGRRYLHAKNREFWPEHRDHVHLRWTAKKRLPVDVPARP